MTGVLVVFIVFGLPVLSVLGGYAIWQNAKLREKELEVRELEAHARLAEAEVRQGVDLWRPDKAAPGFTSLPEPRTLLRVVPPEDQGT